MTEKKQPTLSVVTYASYTNTKEFYLAELVGSVYDLADEIIIVDGDKGIGIEHQETMNMIHKIRGTYKDAKTGESKIFGYYNPWENRLGNAMGRIQRSVAISHATCDWVILLDADEVLDERDHDKIRQAMIMADENNWDVLSFRTTHFYRDYWHTKSGANPSDPGQVWYNHRPKMFRNNLGIIDMHDRFGNYSGLIVRDFEDKAGDFADAQCVAQHTSIEVFHYGHVRSRKAYVAKTNHLEQSYHPEWVDIDPEKFEWDMTGAHEFVGEHPKAMSSRIKAFEEYFGKDGDIKQEKTEGSA